MDDVAEEFEAHFVHQKIGLPNQLAGDAIAVLSVCGNVVQSPVAKDIFKELIMHHLLEKITLKLKYRKYRHV